MPAAKITDERQMARWIEEGKPYQEITELHERQYGIPIAVGTVSAFASRRGLSSTHVRVAVDHPWRGQVKAKHNYKHTIRMIRVLQRKHRDVEIAGDEQVKLAGWLARMKAGDLVVVYDPEAKDGWDEVSRGEGVKRGTFFDPFDPASWDRYPS